MAMPRIRINGHGVVYLDGNIIGSVRNHGCDNEYCLMAVRNGDHWHAIPVEGTLPVYHYYWLESAIEVLRAAWNDWVGDHQPTCMAVRCRRDLLEDMTKDPGNPYLEGAWVEYFAGGDQESELCDCGRF